MTEHQASPARQVATNSARRPRSSSPGVSPAPSDLFAQQTTPIPALLGSGGTIFLNTGGGGGVSGDAAGPGLASTPEPGSMILLGTGLIGLVGVLRRRRV